MSYFSERDRKLFQHIRDFARRKYEARSDNDVEITDEISKTADGGFWVTARVFVSRADARAERDRKK